MKKMIAMALSIAITTGCSCFAGSKQKVTVMTNVQNAEVFANGERVGHGTNVQFSAKRNKNVQIMAKAPGYYPAYKSIDTNISVAGVLDIIGIFVWLVPIVGVFMPGFKTLDENNIAVELVPAGQTPQTNS